MNKKLILRLLVGLALVSAMAFAGPVSEFVTGIYTELVSVARLIGGILVIAGVIGVSSGTARPASLIGVAMGVFLIIKSDVVVGWLQSI